MKSILSDDKTRCYLCGSVRDLETHHIFGGANRKKSDADGLVVTLCRRCHDAVHFSADNSLMKELRAESQRKWIQYYGKSRKDFRKRYGKNYEQ